MKGKVGAFYVAQPHHMRLWEPVFEKLRERGLEVIYFTSHTKYPFEISAFSFGKKPFFLEELLTLEDLEREEEIYSYISNVMAYYHKFSKPFRALAPINLSSMIRNVIRESILMEKFLKTRKVDVVFALHELNRWGKLLAYITFKLGIPFVTLQEGAYYSRSFSLRFHSEYSSANLIWGRQTLELLLELGNAPEKNVIVGDTHLDRAIPYFFGKERKFKREVCKELKLDIKRPLILLIQGSGIEREIILGAVIKNLPLTDRYNFVLKLHPNVTRESTEKFQEKFTRENFKIVQLYDSYELLTASDACVSIGVSTLTFEAFAFKKPVVELKYDEAVKGYFSRWGICPLVSYQEVEEALQELLGGGYRKYEGKLKEWLPYAFYKLDCKATERVAFYVNFLIEETERYKAEKVKKFRFKENVCKRLSLIFAVNEGNLELIKFTLFNLSKFLNPEKDEVILVFPEELSVNLSREELGRSLRFLVSPRKGLSDMLNVGVENSRGEFIAVLEEGVVPVKWNLEAVLGERLKSSRQIYTAVLLDKNGKVSYAGYSFNHNCVLTSLYRGADLVDLAKLSVNPVPSANFFILTGREVFGEVGQFDTRLNDFYAVPDFTLRAYYQGIPTYPSLAFVSGDFLRLKEIPETENLRFYTKHRNEKVLSIVSRT